MNGQTHIHCATFGREFKYSIHWMLAAVLMLASLLGADPVRAEGSRTMFPSGIAGARANLELTNSGLYAGAVRNRQFIYVFAQANEYILVGSRNRANNGDVFIYNPQSFGTRGDETIPGAANFTCSTVNAGPAAFGGGTLGRITTRANELAGPNSADSTVTVVNGWNPCAYRAPSTGIYGVRFSGATGGGVQALTVQSANVGALLILANQVSAWEVVVRATNTSTTDLSGRVFTYGWVGRTGGNGAAARIFHTLYYVTLDGYRYEQIQRGLDPFAYAMYSNAQGYVDAGDPLYKSVRGNNQLASVIQPAGTGIVVQAAQYPILFANPSPSGANATEVDLTLTALGIATVPPVPQLISASYAGDFGGSTSTQGAGGTFTFETVNTLSYQIVISFDGVDYDPANPLNRVLNGTALTGTHLVVWDGLDNAGNAMPVGSFPYRVTGRNGEVHFPLVDTEGMALGGPTVRQLNGSLSTTVYFDDRGYITSNSTAVGALNGHLCGAGHLQVEPSPRHSLLGLDSNDANFGGSGFYYRRYPDVSNNSNADCTNDAAAFFGDAKALDLWAFERTSDINQTLSIVVLSDVSATLSAIPDVVSPGQVLTGLTLTCTNGGAGAATVATCVPSVDVGTVSNIVCTPTQPQASLAVGASIVCTFDYTAPGTAGGSDTGDTAVNFTGTTSATNDNTLLNNSDSDSATIIDAIDDATSLPDGSTGQTFDVAGNDEYPPGSTFTLTGGSCANASLTGAGLATFDVTPNPCTLTYSVCAPAPDATVCDDATLTVTGTLTDMEATLGAIPDVVSPGQVLTGLTLTCANIGANAAVDATCVPSVDVGTVSNIVCTPTQPQASLAVGASIVCTFDYTAPGTAGGSDTGDTAVNFTGTTSATNDNTLLNNSDSDSATIIDAIDDATSLPDGSTGQTFDVAGNDEYPPGSTFTLTGGSCANASLTGAGLATFDVTPNPCTLTYSVCAPAPDATVCDDATLTVTGTLTDMEATLGAIPDVVSPGQTLTGLTLTCTNIGADTAVDATCVPSVDVGAISNIVCVPTQPQASLASGASIVCTFDYTAPGTAGGSDTTETAVIFTGTTSATNDTTLANNSDTDGATLIDALDDDFSAAPINTTTGGTTASVFGNDGLGAVAVTTGSVTPSIFNDGGLTGVVINADGTLTIPPGTPGGTYPVIYQICTLTPPVPAVCDTATATVFVATPALNTLKALTGNTDADISGSVTPGDVLTFTITVTNTGDMTLTNVVVTDSLITPSGGTTPCASVPVGNICTLIGTYLVTAGDAATGSITNIGTGDSNETGPDSDTLITPVVVPQLTLTKTASPNPFIVGQAATYTITVTNTGTAATTAIATISDTINAGLTIGALPAGCGAAGQVITCTIPAGLAVGANASFIIPITPTITAVDGNNTATVTGGGDPTCPLNGRCDDTVLVPITTPQLTLTKTASPNPFIVGQAATYTITVTNTGTAATTAIATISDTINAGLTIGALPAGCGAAGQLITCTIPAGLAVGANASFIIPITPTITAVDGNNTATVTGGGDPTCPLNARCDDTVLVPITTPQLTLTKTASPNPFIVGQAASYTITVTNTGTAATTAIATISDTINAGLTIGALPAGCTPAGQVVTCTIASGLAVGANQSFIIPITPTITAVNGNNTATVTGGGDPTCPLNARCDDTVLVPITTPQLTLTKTASVSPFVVGVPASYTITVTNTGTAATTAVATISDTINAGLTIGALPVGCGAAGQVITCTIASGLAVGANQSFIIPITPTITAVNGNNTATVTGGGDPTCPLNGRCDDTVLVPITTPQLTLTKTASVSPFVVGVPASYTITVTNTGTAATTAIATISDTINAGLTIGALPVGCGAAGQVITCTIASGLAVGANQSFIIPITPTVTAVNGNNTATVTGGGDPTCPLNGRCDDTVLVPITTPQLTLTKTASVSPFVVGVPASYTITVTNTGTAATTAVATISDTINAGLTIGALPVGCGAAGQVITCTIASGLAVGANQSFIIPITPTITAVNGNNTATVTGGGDPTCPLNGRCDDTVLVPITTPQLTLTKTASVSPFVVGVPASYTITVTNTGTAATTAIATISDTINAGLTIGALPVGCGAAGQVITCTIASGLAVGANQSFIIPITPTITAVDGNNTATVTGGGDPTCPLNARCDDTVLVPITTPQLTLTKTASVSPFVVGVPASYTITVTNTGTAATTAIATISDTINAGLTIGALPVGCGAAGQVITCTIASGLAVGANQSFIIPITPTITAVDGNNTATVTGGGDPTCPLNARCDDTVLVPITTPQLTLTKTASPNPFIVGQAATYTITVTNTGTAATTAIATISDTINAGLTIGALPAGCGAAGQVITCTIPAGLAVGANASFIIPITPTITAVDGNNTATVTGGGDPTCPLNGRCDDTVLVPITTPQLTLTKTASPNPFIVGQAATYTITVTNTGTAATTAIATISDTINAGLTIGALPAGCGAAGQVITCTIPAGLAVGANASFIIPITPTITAVDGNNTATVTGGGDPTCPLNGRCDDTVLVPITTPQLTLTKTASPNPFIVGQAATYTITVTNTGTAATTAIATISDTINAGLTIGALPAGCGAAGQLITCTIPAGLAVGANASFIIPITPTITAVDGNNTATVTGGGDPTCPLNGRCDDTVLVPITTPQLTLTKTASVSPFVVGVPASYTITVTNTGTAATTAIATISDTINAGLTIGALPAGCGAAGQLITCTIPAGLAVGANASFIIPITPTITAVDGNNTATVTGGGDPTCPLNARCDDTVLVPITTPQLTLTKTASPNPFIVGQAASYTITVTNTGTAATTAIATISDTINAGLTIGALPAGCTPAGQVVTCTIASGLAVGANQSFIIPITPTITAVDGNNTATVTGGGDPTCPLNARCDDTVLVPITTPQLTLTKTASPNPFIVGQAASYTITVTNTGTAATTAIATISDTINAGLTIGALPAGCTPAGQVVTCTIASGLAVGANQSFIIPITPTITAVNGNNTATVTGGGDPTCPLNARCDDTVLVPITTPQLTLTKTASPNPFIVGQAATYTITVTNTGTAATTAIATISDTINAGLTIGALPAGCGAAGQLITCTIPAGLAVGANASFIIPVTPTITAVDGNNTATVTGGGDPTCPLNARCDDTVLVPLTSLRLTKAVTSLVTTGPNTYNIAYLIVVSNIGGTGAFYTLNDTLGYPATGVSFNGSGRVQSVDGAVNPGLPGGVFALANGVSVQLSGTLVPIAIGTSHSYQVTVPIAVASGGISDGACTGAPGGGAFNAASITGSQPLSTNACAPIENADVGIRLVKTVRLGIDNNGNHYGDVGDVLTYDFVISNPGATLLTSVRLLDPRVSDLTCSPSTTLYQELKVLFAEDVFSDAFERDAAATLITGDSVVCAATHTLTAADVSRRRVDNTAIASGVGPQGQLATSVSTAIFTSFQ